VKKLNKMHWYVYNNNIPLLYIVKTWIFHPIYNFKMFKFSTISSASLPAVRSSSTSAMAPDFYTRKIIVSSLQNCYSEGLFIHCAMVFPFIRCSFLSLLLPFKRWETHERGVNRLQWLLITYKNSCLYTVNLIMKHAPIYNRHDVFACVLLYNVSFEIARLHAWTNRFWMFFDCNLQ